MGLNLSLTRHLKDWPNIESGARVAKAAKKPNTAPLKSSKSW